MKMPVQLSAILSAAILSASEAAAQAESPMAGGARRAAPVFGAGLSVPDLVLAPALALPGWSFRGALGGIDADADGWWIFRMPTFGYDGAPVLDGRARFEAAPDGAVAATWRIVPTGDADLLETFVGGNVPASAIAGGRAIIDGREIAVALDGVNPHLFRGEARNLSLRGPDGAECLRVAFARPTRILLQDGAHWGAANLTLRFFLAEGPVKGGTEYALDATVSTPAAGRLDLAPGGGVAIEAGPDWIPLAGEPWIEAGSALDFSAVVPHHAPAGKFGRVVAAGGHFEFEGLPGVPQRFYGVNICFDACTPSTPEASDRFAAQLARVGYNALRIHHHEGSLLDIDTTRRPGMDDTAPDPAAMERFDSLVAACIEHGIYLTTDLYVSRSHFTTWRSLGIDRDGSVPQDSYKILCAFWEPAFENLCAWSRAFLGHVNPRTGRSLAEEPALVCLALINEGNLGNWGGAALRDIPGVQEAWKEWLSAKADDPAFAGIPAEIPDSLMSVGDTPAGRHAGAIALFLAEREMRLAGRLRAFLRDELHCRVPLSSLSCWYNPVQYQLVRERCFDYVDDHFYVDHPSFLDRPWALPSCCDNRNPVTGPAAGAKSVEWRRIMGKPFCLTEWNYSGPGRFRGVGGIATGALGALQDWSGMWRFAWSHGRDGVEKPETRALGYFDMSGDPLGLAAERAAICLFLRRDLPELAAEYPLVLDEAALRDPRTGAPSCEVSAALGAGWLARVGSRIAGGGGEESRDGPSASIGTTAEQAAADLAALGAEKRGNGAISIDSVKGTFILDTPRTAGGFAESGSHVAGPLAFEILPPGNRQESSMAPDAAPPRAADPVPATVWVSSLDGEPIAASSHLLLTHLTDVQNSGIRYGDPDLSILLAWGHLPHLMRNGAARVGLSLAANGGESGETPWRVFRLAPSGRRVGEAPAAWDPAAGTLSFVARTDFDPSSATYLYEIVRAGSMKSR